MNEIVGIDLGTTNSLIGVMDAGFPILLADKNGTRLTPSVVHLARKSSPLVGQPAARMRALKPAETVYSIKRFMGLRGDELREKDADVSYLLERKAGKAVRVLTNERTYSPEEISALILGKLKSDAEAALGHEVTRAVITVPAYFNDAQRNATKCAGERAGFAVERIVNEPTAAALAYGLDKLKSRSKIAVFDLGGGTFDISILELDNGVFEVLATNGNTRLGGDDIDRALLDSLAETEVRKPAVTQPAQLARPGFQSRARLLEPLIEAKHRLSTEEEVSIDIPFFEGADSFHFKLTREELEKIARPIIEQTRAHCLRSLADAKLRPTELDDVILVGGVTRMPLVRRLVSEIFGREPNTSQNPDEAVAIGATVQAGILSGAVRDVVLLDVTPLSLGIETFGGLMNVIIPRNSTIPIKAGEMFTTAVNQQRSMSIKVLQGEREMARDNWRLGEFEIEFEPALKGVARVGVQFEIDANGILHVLARDTKTGAEKIVEIKSAVDVSDEAVEAMISESLEHAFDDMSERVWTETKLKSEEMLRAVDAAFAQMGDAIDPAEKEKIEEAAKAVRQALETHDARKLKSANDALDEATQDLAAAIVTRAMRAG
ncbi:MAG TPA: molecular chaperone DnaK [Chthoniobacterales bacterium]|nr:molecular chaperone DnaK [Chthoniobacterales bacterium]